MALDSTSAITQGWDVRQNTHTHTYTFLHANSLSSPLYFKYEATCMWMCMSSHVCAHTLCTRHSIVMNVILQCLRA